MKIKIISAAIILASLFACTPKEAMPVATFNEPQPANIESLPTFPKRLQGQYLSLKDSSMLSINDKFIQRTYNLDFKIHSKALDSLRQDSRCQIKGDTLIFLDIHKKMKIIKQVGDSLLIRGHSIDTLFQIGRNNILRKFKGFYFLNTRYDSDSWEVKKVQLTKGVLVISRILDEADIKKLEEITETETPQDTVRILPHTFTTTKKQFKTFIKNEGFSNSETFVKQR